MNPRRFIRSAWLRLSISVAAIVLAWVFLLAFDWLVVYWALIGLSLGVSIGGILGFNHGFDVRVEILEEIYGEDWEWDLSRGYWRRRAQEQWERGKEIDSG